ncbi:MAG TPA: hypothetical protein VLA78_12250 [Paracoccaceae bacterium]|nr:hypothetical protein [Paracoccaceae bacterium]
MTLGIDIGVIKMILTHAAAVHGLEIRVEGVDWLCCTNQLMAGASPSPDRLVL